MTRYLHEFDLILIAAAKRHAELIILLIHLGFAQRSYLWRTDKNNGDKSLPFSSYSGDENAAFFAYLTRKFSRKKRGSKKGFRHLSQRGLCPQFYASFINCSIYYFSHSCSSLHIKRDPISASKGNDDDNGISYNTAIIHCSPRAHIRIWAWKCSNISIFQLF